LDQRKPLPEDAPLEQVIERLEAIVQDLESGETDLEAGIDLFREGKQLGTRALDRLEKLERRVEIVVRGEDGAPETEDFPEQ